MTETVFHKPRATLSWEKAIISNWVASKQIHAPFLFSHDWADARQIVMKLTRILLHFGENVVVRIQIYRTLGPGWVSRFACYVSGMGDAFFWSVCELWDSCNVLQYIQGKHLGLSDRSFRYAVLTFRRIFSFIIAHIQKLMH